MDGSVRVFESGAIMLYLVQKHPDAGLYSQVGLQSRVPGLFFCQRATACRGWCPSPLTECPVVLNSYMLLFERCAVCFCATML